MAKKLFPSSTVPTSSAKNRFLARSFAKGFELEFESTVRAVIGNQGVHTFTNLRVPTDKGYTSIDVVALVGKNIFVGEMKNYAKCLRGQITDLYWYGDTGRREYKIRNPLRQNFHHVTSIAFALRAEGCSLSGVKIRDFIVVPDTCDRSELQKELDGIVLSTTQWEVMLSGVARESAERPQSELIRVCKSWR